MPTVSVVKGHSLPSAANEIKARSETKKKPLNVELDIDGLPSNQSWEDLFFIAENSKLQKAVVRNVFTDGSLCKLLKALGNNQYSKRLHLDISGNEFNEQCYEELKTLLSKKLVNSVTLPAGMKSGMAERLLGFISFTNIQLKALVIPNTLLSESSIGFLTNILKNKLIKHKLDLSGCTTCSNIETERDQIQAACRVSAGKRIKTSRKLTLIWEDAVHNQEGNLSPAESKESIWSSASSVRSKDSGFGSSSSLWQTPSITRSTLPRLGKSASFQSLGTDSPVRRHDADSSTKLRSTSLLSHSSRNLEQLSSISETDSYLKSREALTRSYSTVKMGTPAENTNEEGGGLLEAKVRQPSNETHNVKSMQMEKTTGIETSSKDGGYQETLQVLVDEQPTICENGEKHVEKVLEDLRNDSGIDDDVMDVLQNVLDNVCSQDLVKSSGETETSMRQIEESSKISAPVYIKDVETGPETIRVLVGEQPIICESDEKRADKLVEDLRNDSDTDADVTDVLQNVLDNVCSQESDNKQLLVLPISDPQAYENMDASEIGTGATEVLDVDLDNICSKEICDQFPACPLSAEIKPVTILSLKTYNISAALLRHVFVECTKKEGNFHLEATDSGPCPLDAPPQPHGVQEILLFRSLYADNNDNLTFLFQLNALDNELERILLPSKRVMFLGVIPVREVDQIRGEISAENLEFEEGRFRLMVSELCNGPQQWKDFKMFISNDHLAPADGRIVFRYRERCNDLVTFDKGFRYKLKRGDADPVVRNIISAYNVELQQDGDIKNQIQGDATVVQLPTEGQGEQNQPNLDEANIQQPQEQQGGLLRVNRPQQQHLANAMADLAEYNPPLQQGFDHDRLRLDIEQLAERNASPIVVWVVRLGIPILAYILYTIFD